MVITHMGYTVITRIGYRRLGCQFRLIAEVFAANAVNEWFLFFGLKTCFSRGEDNICGISKAINNVEAKMMLFKSPPVILEYLTCARAATLAMGCTLTEAVNEF